jgi:hypothetical protein
VLVAMLARVFEAETAERLLDDGKHDFAQLHLLGATHLDAKDDVEAVLGNVLVHHGVVLALLHDKDGKGVVFAELIHFVLEAV